MPTISKYKRQSGESVVNAAYVLCQIKYNRDATYNYYMKQLLEICVTAIGQNCNIVYSEFIGTAYNNTYLVL